MTNVLFVFSVEVLFSIFGLWVNCSSPVLCNPATTANNSRTMFRMTYRQYLLYALIDVGTTLGNFTWYALRICVSFVFFSSSMSILSRCLLPQINREIQEKHLAKKVLTYLCCWYYFGVYGGFDRS